MFLLFGAKTRARPVEGGLTETRHCDDCERATQFRECDVKDKLTVFFVEVADSTQRRMVCTQCGHDVEVVRARPIAAAPKRTLEPAKRAFTTGEKDDLLAQLKAKMGK